MMAGSQIGPNDQRHQQPALSTYPFLTPETPCNKTSKGVSKEVSTVVAIHHSRSKSTLTAFKRA